MGYFLKGKADKRAYNSRTANAKGGQQHKIHKKQLLFAGNHSAQISFARASI
jgi:hypothetical protein